MPRKVRELETDLLKAGFEKRPGKGSHRVYTHPKFSGVVTISGRAGDDAKRYQEKQVAGAIEEAEE
jgi:predicted RNA binding protein YcfA (HicA-like mRNA interferase family)